VSVFVGHHNKELTYLLTTTTLCYDRISLFYALFTSSDYEIKMLLRNFSRICSFSSRYLRICRSELFAVRVPLLHSGSVEGVLWSFR